jgi:hypothetical protein
MAFPFAMRTFRAGLEMPPAPVQPDRSSCFHLRIFVEG